MRPSLDSSTGSVATEIPATCQFALVPADFIVGGTKVLMIVHLQKLPNRGTFHPSGTVSNLTSSFVHATDDQSDDELSPFRKMLQGNDDYFLHIVSDAGFEHLAPNLNNDNVILLKDLCEGHGVMFTSTKVHIYVM